MSVFESILLVLNKRAATIKFFVILPIVCKVDWILQNGPMSNSMDDITRRWLLQLCVFVKFY